VEVVLILIDLSDKIDVAAINAEVDAMTDQEVMVEAGFHLTERWEKWEKDDEWCIIMAQEQP
jgi:hypothetical protein